MAICFHLLQVLALSETYIMICLDQTISKGISELIWIYGIFMQHGFAGSHWTVKYERWKLCSKIDKNYRGYVYVMHRDVT